METEKERAKCLMCGEMFEKNSSTHVYCMRCGGIRIREASRKRSSRYRTIRREALRERGPQK